MKKVVLSGSMANSLEWYDYALYAHFASLFSKIFFPATDPHAALLSTYIIFAIGFLMRPLGAILFGSIGDRYGRKVSLSLAILLMSIPTALVGLLPTYEQIGIWAPILLTIMRLLQGLSLGGALIGSVSYIVEHAEPRHRGIAGSATMFSLCFGFMLGSVVATLLSGLMSEENFVSYGWRLPFLFGIVIMGMSYYIKNHTTESPEFEKARKMSQIIHNPFATLVKSYKKVLLTSIAINSLGSVGFYALAVYVVGFLENVKKLPLHEVTAMSSWTMALIMFVVVIAGWLSDLVGRKRFFVITAISTAILIWPICSFIADGGYTEIVIAQVIFGILVGCWIGPEPALQVEMYPTNVRNTGVAFSYNVGCAIFGGTTPFVCALLANLFSDTIYIMGIYMVIVAILSLVGLYFYKNRADFNMNYDG